MDINKLQNYLCEKSIIFFDYSNIAYLDKPELTEIKFYSEESYQFIDDIHFIITYAESGSVIHSFETFLINNKKSGKFDELIFINLHLFCRRLQNNRHMDLNKYYEEYIHKESDGVSNLEMIKELARLFSKQQEFFNLIFGREIILLNKDIDSKRKSYANLEKMKILCALSNTDPEEKNRKRI